jgi:hypothetical protein
MRRAGIVVASIAIGVVAFSGVAAASTPTSKTTIDQVVVWEGSASQSLFFGGQVHSPRPACIAGRTVKIEIKFADGSTQHLDTDLTSKHGAWSGGGRLNSMFVFDSGIAKVLRKRIGHRHDHRICKADSTPLAIN